jgi:tRNA(Ile)-lysidine synthase
MRVTALGGSLSVTPSIGAGVSVAALRGRALLIEPRTTAATGATRIACGPSARRRTLKNLWQESAVPPWQRDRWPLLWLDGELVCVPGVAVASAVVARPDQPGRVFIWSPDGTAVG